MKELSYKKSGANEMKRKFALRKLFLAFTLLFAIGTIFTISAVETGKVKECGGVVLAVAALAYIKEDGTFKELKGADLTKFMEDSTPEQIAEYYNAKNDAARKEIEKLIAEKDEKHSETIKTMREEMAQDRLDQMKHLNETLKQHGLMIKKLSEKEQADKNVSFFDELRTGLEANKESLSALKNGQLQDANKAQFSFTTKAAGTMSISGNVSGGNVPVEQRIAGLNTIASRRVRLMDLVSSGNATSPLISWVYQANKDGAAAGTTEGSAKNQIDYDLVVASQAVVKQTAFIKVTTEMLDDIDYIQSEINNELMRELMKRVELTAYSGNNSGANMNGVYTTATTFAAGSFATSVDNANEVDVLVVAANQIAIAEQPTPTAILMHPTDVTKLKLVKVSSTDKRYVERLSMIGGSLSMDGIPIIPTTLVTAGTFLIGAFDMATLYTKQGVTISIGLDADDFTKNLRTIIAEYRGAMVVKNNDRTAFVKGTFSTCIAALETP